MFETLKSTISEEACIVLNYFPYIFVYSTKNPYWASVFVGGHSFNIVKFSDI